MKQLALHVEMLLRKCMPVTTISLSSVEVFADVQCVIIHLDAERSPRSLTNEQVPCVGHEML